MLAAGALVADLPGLPGSVPAGASTTWAFTATGTMLAARAGATATVLANGDVLVAGGVGASGAPLSSVELYRSATGTFVATGWLPLPVTEAAATLLPDGDVLVAGGLTSSAGGLAPTAAAQRYDPATGHWQLMSGALQVASFGGSAALLSSGKVLYAGGLTATGASASATSAAELYDPVSSTWSATAPLPLPVGFAASARLPGGSMLVAGGVTGGSGGLTDLAAVYDPAAPGWAPVDHLPTAVAAATTSVLGSGAVLVAGGMSSSSGAVTGAAQRFDPGSGHWSTVGSLPFASAGATATVLGSGQVLYAGGFTSGAGAPTARTAVYGPSSATWATGPDLLVARGDAVAARLPNGDALVAGGRTPSGVTGEAERLVGGTAPVFTTPALVQLRAGVYASVEVRATGVPTPALTMAGTLPPGLAFQAHQDGTATIAGVPYPGDVPAFTVLVTASNGVGVPVVQQLTLVFDRAPVITSASSRTVPAGSFTSLVVTATGVPTPRLVAYGTLPPDLRFRDNGNGTATIDGVVRRGLQATYPVTVVASNGVGAPAVQRLVLRVQEAPVFTTAGTVTVPAGSGVRFEVRASGLPAPSLSLQGTLPRALSFQPEGPGAATISGTLAPGVRGVFAVTVVAANGVGAPVTQSLRIEVTPVPDPRGVGYWYTTSTGQVVAKGSAAPIAPRTPQHPRDVVGMAAMPDGDGYYLVSSYGGVFNYGSAPFYGSIAARHLRARTVAIAVVPSGDGYYEVTDAGNVFGFGRAPFYGSTAGRRLAPVVALSLTPDARGYWLVTSRGNVYGFGDARFFGSPARQPISAVVGLAPTPSGQGYWVATVTGDVLSFGDAVTYGSLTGRRVPPVVAIAATRTGQGYWLVTSAGNVFDHGDAAFYGSSSGVRLSGRITGFAPDF